MWPYFTTALDRRLNRSLLLRQLTRLVKRMPSPPVAVTTIPIVADLVGRLPVARWVYYCVDDFGEWPGLDHEPLRRMEEGLIRKADVVIAVSETLCEKLARLGRDSHLLTHGVDLDHWKKVSGTVSQCETVPDTFSRPFSRLEKPLVVFWGVVDRRMDTAWVKALASSLTTGAVLLVGPLADPDPELLTTPRVVHLPPMDYDDLPDLARAASVLMMPYADLPVTRAMQPLKLKEYLATGLPTVVRDLPANRPWGNCLDLADSPETFVRAVRQRLETGLPSDQREARVRLQAEGWDEKARLFERWVLQPSV
jgi:glycosyltransferase involved in cell wall biosynthesis